MSEKKHITLQTEAEQIESLKHYGNDISFIKFPTNEMKLAAVKQNGFLINDIANPTKEMCIEAVKQQGRALYDISEFYPELLELNSEYTNYYEKRSYIKMEIKKMITPIKFESYKEIIAKKQSQYYQHATISEFNWTIEIAKDVEIDAYYENDDYIVADQCFEYSKEGYNSAMRWIEQKRVDFIVDLIENKE